MANNISINGLISDIKLGNSQITGVYKGTSLIWGSGTIIPKNMFINPQDAIYSGDSIAIITEEAVAISVLFNTDGTKMYVLGTGDNGIDEYILSSPFALYTAVPNYFFDTGIISPFSFSFKNDGTRFFLTDNGDNTVRQYSLTTAWDLSTANYDSILISTVGTTPLGIHVSDDGLHMFILNQADGVVQAWSLTTAWDLSTATLVVGGVLNTGTSDLRDITFNSTGTRLLILNTVNSIITLWELTTAWDLTTATTTINSLSTLGESSGNSINGFYVTSTEDMLFTVDLTTDKIFKYAY